MDTPVISIIVPVYNLQDYITPCVQSICAQIYSNLEIILVDDGSTDNSPRILLELATADPRIRIITQANSGAAKARFTGIRAATGEWLGFVDGDDYLEPEMYASLLKNALEYCADISHCGHKMVFPDRVDYYGGDDITVVADNFTAIKQLFSGAIEPNLWSKLYKKSLFDGLLAHESEIIPIRYLEDLLMNYYLFGASGKSVYRGACLYNYCIRKNSVMTSSLSSKRLEDPVKVFDLLYASCAESGECLNSLYSRRLACLCRAMQCQSPFAGDLRSTLCELNRRLRAEVKLAKKHDCPLRDTLIAYLAAYLPCIYRLVHGLYARFRGSFNKYAV